MQGSSSQQLFLKKSRAISTVDDVTDDKMFKRPEFTAAPKSAFDVFTALLKYNSQSPLTQET